MVNPFSPDYYNELTWTPFGAAAFGEGGPTADDYKQLGLAFGARSSTSNGGVPITTKQMNLLGYLATIGQYLQRMGYPFGNTPIEWPIEINGVSVAGYPKGAVVTVLDEDTGYVREYISLQDNNTDKLPWDRSKGTGDSGEITGLDENSWWKPVVSKTQYNFFPDFSQSSYQGFGGQAEAWSQTVERTGWCKITRTFSSDYSDIVADNILSGTYNPKVEITIDGATSFSINVMDGSETNRLIPVGEKIEIKVSNDIGKKIRVGLNWYSFIGS